MWHVHSKHPRKLGDQGAPAWQVGIRVVSCGGLGHGGARCSFPALEALMLGFLFMAKEVAGVFLGNFSEYVIPPKGDAI